MRPNHKVDHNCAQKWHKGRRKQSQGIARVFSHHSQRDASVAEVRAVADANQKRAHGPHARSDREQLRRAGSKNACEHSSNRLMLSDNEFAQRQARLVKGEYKSD
jgi:hypothetical protein